MSTNFYWYIPSPGRRVPASLEKVIRAHPEALNNFKVIEALEMVAPEVEKPEYQAILEALESDAESDAQLKGSWK